MSTGLAIEPHRQSGQATPADYARSAPTPPVLSRAGKDWRHIQIERFQVPFLRLDLGASTVHRVTLHLAGPVEIERNQPCGRDRAWSHSGCSNLIPAGTPVTRSFSGAADFMVAYIAPSIVDQVAAEAYDLNASTVSLTESLAVADETIDRFGRLLLLEAASRATGNRLLVDTLTRGLVLHLLRAYCAVAPRSICSTGKLVTWRLRRVLDYMNANLAEDMPLAQLAGLVGLGPVQFARAFRAATGTPPHNFLVGLRLDQAKRLLESTGLSVTEIGLCCGFDQPSHFATMFRKRTGMAPSAYRSARDP